MPVIIHYTITQTRMVDVSANNISDAVQIAEAAFQYGQNSDYTVNDDNDGRPVILAWGYPTSRIKEVALDVNYNE